MFEGLGGGAATQDNASPRAKLLLRRHFLDTYHADAKRPRPFHDGSAQPRPSVFDACQAGGLLWGALRKEYDVRYWGVDLVAKKGRLKIDSARILAQPSLPFDIIDIDTYGTPWHHWLVLLPHLRRPVTIFLTLGRAGGLNDVGNDALSWLGLETIMGSVPQALRWKLADYATETLLAAPYAFGFKIVEAKEATASKNARYIGVRLAPEAT